MQAKILFQMGHISSENCEEFDVNIDSRITS